MNRGFFRGVGVGLCLFCLSVFGEESRPVKAALFPFREAVVVSEIDGLIRNYTVRIGEHFKSGDCIVTIDDTRYRIEVARAEAKLEEIAVQAKFAGEAYRSQKKLFEEDFQSKIEFERRKTEFDTLTARAKIAQTECDEARLRLSYCKKTAPFDGRLEEMFCRTHETVRAGQPLYRIIDDRRLLAVMNIPLGELRPIGEVLRFLFEDGKCRADGKIWEVAPRADHRSGTIEVKVLLDNRDGRLTAGMTGVWVQPAASGRLDGRR